MANQTVLIKSQDELGSWLESYLKDESFSADKYLLEFDKNLFRVQIKITGDKYDSTITSPVMDERGITPLMLASSIYQNVDVLIRAGANLNLQCDDGRTALMIAAQFGADPRVIPLFLQHGADARLRDNTGRTALDWFDMNQRLNRHPIRRELWERAM